MIISALAAALGLALLAGTARLAGVMACFSALALAAIAFVCFYLPQTKRRGSDRELVRLSRRNPAPVLTPVGLEYTNVAVNSVLEWCEVVRRRSDTHV
jgi:hypothetical protein